MPGRLIPPQLCLWVRSLLRDSFGWHPEMLVRVPKILLCTKSLISFLVLHRGAGSDGRLGLGDTTNRGDGAGELGDNLEAVNLGTNRTAIAVSAGIYHTCAILDDSTVKCWGCVPRIKGMCSSEQFFTSTLGHFLPAPFLLQVQPAISIGLYSF